MHESIYVGKCTAAPCYICGHMRRPPSPSNSTGRGLLHAGIATSCGWLACEKTRMANTNCMGWHLVHVGKCTVRRISMGACTVRLHRNGRCVRPETVDGGHGRTGHLRQERTLRTLTNCKRRALPPQQAIGFRGTTQRGAMLAASTEECGLWQLAASNIAFAHKSLAACGQTQCPPSEICEQTQCPHLATVARHSARRLPSQRNDARSPRDVS